MIKNTKLHFYEVEEKILHDREYILGLLKKVKIDNNEDISIIGSTIAKLSEILARQNQQLLDVLKARMSVKKINNGSSIDEDYKDIADSTPVQFEQTVSS